MVLPGLYKVLTNKIGRKLLSQKSVKINPFSTIVEGWIHLFINVYKWFNYSFRVKTSLLPTCSVWGSLFSAFYPADQCCKCLMGHYGSWGTVFLLWFLFNEPPPPQNHQSCTYSYEGALILCPPGNERQCELYSPRWFSWKNPPLYLEFILCCKSFVHPWSHTMFLLQLTISGPLCVIPYKHTQSYNHINLQLQAGFKTGFCSRKLNIEGTSLSEIALLIWEHADY